MQKLTISNEELEKHRRYFYEHGVENLKQLRAKTREVDFWSRRKRKLISLCLYYKKQLAIGKPYQLRRIQKIIDQKFGDILKDKAFKKELEKAFGYEQFSCVKVGEETVENAKKRCGAKEYNDRKIVDQITDDLECIDARLEMMFVKRVLETRGRRTKEILVNIVSQVLITGVQEGVTGIGALEEWNPYLMQFNRRIRTCPYCNRQYITPLYSDNGKIRADLDHFYSKSRYPYFSMSIYNLVPCCKFCNSSLKGVREFEIEVKTPYEISIDDMAVFEYLPGSRREVKLSYKDKTVSYKDKTVSHYNEMFKIEELYKYHSNVGERIKEASDRYTPERIKEIVESGLISEKELYQMIVGKVSRKEEILEEPLNKLKRDFVKGILGEEVLDMVTE